MIRTVLQPRYVAMVSLASITVSLTGMALAQRTALAPPVREVEEMDPYTLEPTPPQDTEVVDTGGLESTRLVVEPISLPPRSPFLPPRRPFLPPSLR